MKTSAIHPTKSLFGTWNDVDDGNVGRPPICRGPVKSKNLWQGSVKTAHLFGKMKFRKKFQPGDETEKIILPSFQFESRLICAVISHLWSIFYGKNGITIVERYCRSLLKKN